MSQIILFLRVLLLLLCFAGVLHEVYVAFTYESVLNLNKSPVTIFYYFFLIVVSFIYDRTNFFSEPIFKIRTSLFWGIIVFVILFEMLTYAALYRSFPLDSRMHKFAPFNFFVALMLFVVSMACVFGERHFGFLNKIKNRKTRKLGND